MPVHEQYADYIPDQREFFDRLITEEWHTYASESWDLSRRFEIARLFSKIRPRTILDIGCGCGFHDREMAAYPFVERVDAIDYSQKSIEQASQHYPHEKVHRWVEDFSQPGRATSYDLVVSFQVFEHLPDPDVYLQRCKALLRPGGVTAIFTPNWRRLDNRIRLGRGGEPMLLDPQHLREYTPDLIEQLARKHGMQTRFCFSYDLTSLEWPWLNRINQRMRLSAGRFLPALANTFCISLEPIQPRS